MATSLHGLQQVLLHSTPLEVPLLHSNCSWWVAFCTTVTVDAAQLKQDVRLHQTLLEVPEEVQLHSIPLEKLFRNSCLCWMVLCTKVTVRAAELPEEVRLLSTPVEVRLLRNQIGRAHV